MDVQVKLKEVPIESVTITLSAKEASALKQLLQSILGGPSLELNDAYRLRGRSFQGIAWNIVPDVFAEGLAIKLAEKGV